MFAFASMRRAEGAGGQCLRRLERRSGRRGRFHRGMVVAWFPDFHAQIDTRCAFFQTHDTHSVIHCEVVPLPEEERERERDLFTIYVCTSRIKFDGRPRKKVFPNPQRDLSRHESLADDRTSQVWHCPLFSAFVDERSLEPTKFRWISNLWERFVEYHVNVSKFFFFFLLLWWSRDINFILVALYLCGRSLQNSLWSYI